MGKVKKILGKDDVFCIPAISLYFFNILILTRIVQGDIICGWDRRIGNNIALKVDKLRFIAPKGAIKVKNEK